MPQPPPPGALPPYAERFVEIIEEMQSLVDAASALVNVYRQLIEVSTVFVRVQTEVYDVQSRIVAQMPQVLRGFETLAQNTETLAISLSNATAIMEEFNTAFYTDFVGRTITAQNAFNILTASAEMFNRGIQTITRGISFFTEILSRVPSIIESFSNMFSDALNAIYSSFNYLLRGAEDAISALSTSTQTALTNLSNVVGVFSERAGNVFSAVLGTLRNFSESLSRLPLNIVYTQVMLSIRSIVEIERILAPVMLQLRELNVALRVLGQTLSFVGRIVQALLTAVGALGGVFANFARTFVEVQQVLGNVQDNLNRLGTSIMMTTVGFDEGARRANILASALNAVREASERALISLSGLAAIFQQLVATGTPLYTYFAQQVINMTDEIARRLGQLPDTIARTLAEFTATGRVGALQALGVPVTEEMFQAYLAQYGFLGRAPRIVEEQLRVQFLRDLTRFMPAGGAPAGIVQFVQAMQTLGQQLAAMFTEGTREGTRILQQISEEIRAITTGYVAQGLRSVFQFISQMIGAGILDIIRALRQLLATPQVQEILRGLGLVLRAIGAGIAGVISSITGGLRELPLERIQEFFARFASQVYAFIRASIDFVRNVIISIIQQLAGIFGRVDIQVIIVQVISLIRGMFSLGISVLRVIINIQQTAGQILLVISRIWEFLARIFSFFEPFFRFIYNAIAGIFNFFGRFFGLRLPEMPRGLFEEMRQRAEGFAVAAQQLIDNARGMGLTLENVSAVVEGIFTGLTNAAGVAITNFNTYFNEFYERLRAGGMQFSEFSDYIQQVNRRMREFISNLDAYTEMLRRTLEVVAEVALPFAGGRPIRLLPGVTFGGMDIATILAGQLETAIRRVQVRAFELQQWLLYGPFQRGIISPQQILEGLRRELQEMFNIMREAIPRLMETVTIFIERMQRGFALGVTQLQLGFTGAAETGRVLLSMLGEGFARIGQSFRMLMQIAATFPGIEQTIQFQRLWNELLQQTLNILSQIGDVLERYIIVPFRNFLDMLSNSVSLVAALGRNVEGMARAIITFAQRPFEGIMEMFASFLDYIGIFGRRLADAFAVIRRTIIQMVGTEFALALVYFLRGDLMQAAQQVQNAFQRAYEAVGNYIDRIRRGIEIFLQPLNLWVETFRDIRGMLSDINSEVALLPIVFGQVLPQLVAIRNQFEIMLQQSLQQGDFLRSREILRNLIQVQRIITEVLGVGGVFLPAYTPEQLIRQRLAIGVPTAEMITRIGRGELVAEPLAFRAVPVPIYAMFGLPAPFAQRLPADLFRGYWTALTAFANITPFTIEMARQGLISEAVFSGWQQFLSMYSTAMMPGGIPMAERLGQGFTQLSNTFAYYGNLLNAQLERVIGELRTIRNMLGAGVPTPPIPNPIPLYSGLNAGVRAAPIMQPLTPR